MRLAAIAPVALALLVTTGCTTPSGGEAAATRPAPAPGAALPGAEWQVFEIAGQPVAPGSKVTIEFKEGRVFGAASCNRFMGGYTVAADGLAIQMSQMASTMMACPDPLMQQEGSFLGVLGAVTGYSVDAGVLTLKTADGKTIRARK